MGGTGGSLVGQVTSGFEGIFEGFVYAGVRLEVTNAYGDDLRKK